jgi:hypothetical protein
MAFLQNLAVWTELKIISIICYLLSEAEIRPELTPLNSRYLCSGLTPDYSGSRTPWGRVSGPLFLPKPSKYLCPVA